MDLLSWLIGISWGGGWIRSRDQGGWVWSRIVESGIVIICPHLHPIFTEYLKKTIYLIKPKLKHVITVGNGLWQTMDDLRKMTSNRTRMQTNAPSISGHLSFKLLMCEIRFFNNHRQVRYIARTSLATWLVKYRMFTLGANLASRLGSCYRDKVHWLYVSLLIVEILHTTWSLTLLN